MKVDGITLLQMIKDGKIKENTLIEVSGGTRSHLPYIYFGKSTKLYWAHCKTNLQGIVTSDDLLEYDFEIIEEIEKPNIPQKISFKTTETQKEKNRLIKDTINQIIDCLEKSDKE